MFLSLFSGVFLLILLSLHRVAAISQIPLISDEPDTSLLSLNFSSSAPHLFASTYSLLQQWSNTIFPNGHTIAAVEIPAYTLLYHGRIGNDTPASPEWVAFDIDMAYGIMGSTRDSWMLSYQTSRPIKAVYFDGESATLMGLGQLDTQMLHIYGNVSGPSDSGGHFGGLGPEYARAILLCDWLVDNGLGGKGWGFEGVVRMNAGFELIWCNFMSDGLTLVSHLNVTAPQIRLEETKDEEKAGERLEEENGWSDGVDAMDETSSYYPLPPKPTRTELSTSPSIGPIPPNWRTIMGPPNREPFLVSQGWAWLTSATYHYGSNRVGQGVGEMRARLLGCGVLSYYSPAFVNQSLNRAVYERKVLNLTDDGVWKGAGMGGNRTLALKMLARRRRFHHLEEVTTEEAGLMVSKSKTALRGLLQGEMCTGADWTLMTREIVQRTAGHLKVFEELVSEFDATNSTMLRRWMHGVRARSHNFLVSFLEYPHTIDESTWRLDSVLYNETYARCRYRYTRLMVHETLTPEERDLRWAVEEVHGTICTVLLTVGFGIEHAWYTQIETPSPAKHASHLRSLSLHWVASIAELSAWLGWEGEYVSCSEVCAWDERCYIPMWPLLGFTWGGRRPTNGTYPPHRRPYYRGPGYPGYPDRPGPVRPPGRSPLFMGDDTDLWEPKCIKAEYIMGVEG